MKKEYFQYILLGILLVIMSCIFINLDKNIIENMVTSCSELYDETATSFNSYINTLDASLDSFNINTEAEFIDIGTKLSNIYIDNSINLFSSSNAICNLYYKIENIYCVCTSGCFLTSNASNNFDDTFMSPRISNLSITSRTNTFFTKLNTNILGYKAIVTDIKNKFVAGPLKYFNDNILAPLDDISSNIIEIRKTINRNTINLSSIRVNTLPLVEQFECIGASSINPNVCIDPSYCSNNLSKIASAGIDCSNCHSYLSNPTNIDNALENDLDNISTSILNFNNNCNELITSINNFMSTKLMDYTTAAKIAFREYNGLFQCINGSSSTLSPSQLETLSSVKNITELNNWNSNSILNNQAAFSSINFNSTNNLNSNLSNASIFTRFKKFYDEISKFNFLINNFSCDLDKLIQTADIYIDKFSKIYGKTQRNWASNESTGINSGTIIDSYFNDMIRPNIFTIFDKKDTTNVLDTPTNKPRIIKNQ